MLKAQPQFGKVPKRHGGRDVNPTGTTSPSFFRGNPDTKRLNYPRGWNLRVLKQ